MAKIMITLSAVLLAVVYHSYAAPSLTLGLSVAPLPSEDIPDISAACNAEIERASIACNKTAAETITKSGLLKEITDAKTKGDQTKASELEQKAMCCGAWTMLECLEADAKNKCTSADFTMVHTVMELGKQKVATQLCKDYPEKTTQCK